MADQISGVVGEEFCYRSQLMFAWLYNHNIRRVCYNLLNQIKLPQQLLLNISGIILMLRVSGM